jgi:hypothetical protein
MSDISEIVDACRAWCALTDVNPIVGSAKDSWWLRRAIADFGSDFSALNDEQRQMIAGVSDETSGSTDAS